MSQIIESKALIAQAKFLQKKHFFSIEFGIKDLEMVKPQLHKELLEQKTLQTIQKQIDVVRGQLLEMEQRLESLEFQSNVPTSRNKMEIAVKDIFAQMSTIVRVYSRPTQSGLVLIIGHNSEDISNPLRQIQQGIVRLKKKFPNVDFDPWILRSKEIQDEHLHLSKLIFKK